MMNPFPLMFLSLGAHAILRIICGLILVTLGYRHLTSKRAVLASTLRIRIPRGTLFFAVYLALAEVIIGTLFILGFSTQVAALLAIVYALKMLYLRKVITYPLAPSPAFYVLLIGVSLSLFITGAGLPAIDIPL